MVQAVLDKIFDQYVQRFYELNNLEHREFMKWEAAYEFSNFDFDDPTDFVKRLKHLNKTCSVIIDKKSIHPFAALCTCASVSEENAEKVRKMFAALFVDDGNDLTKRQEKIDAFIKESDILRAECGKNGYTYENSQTSVMAYLALRDPDNNYLLSTSKARELGARAGFEDDWGTLKNFKMDVYYRFCDELVAAINANDAICIQNAKRFDSDFVDGKHAPLHTDTNKHLVAFDIIYCASSETYALGSVVPIDPQVVKKYETAKEKQKIYLQVAEKKEALDEALSYLTGLAKVGRRIHHKKNGAGSIAEVSTNEKGDIYVKLNFDKTGLHALKFSFETLYLNNIMTIDEENFEEKKTEYCEILKKKKSIQSEFDAISAELEAYRDYID